MSQLRKIFCISLSFIMLLSGSTIAQATEATIETENEYVIVGNEKTIENIENDYGGEISEDGLILSDITLTKADVRSIVRENDEVIIEENIMFEGDSSETNETETNYQWYRDAIGVDDIEIPENDIKIALIDSGVSYSDDIPVIDSIKLVDDGNESILFSDASGHGTAMAGIIAAQDNDDGITGINPYADIYSAQVLDSDNRGTLSAILEAINWAVANEVDIINMSFGTSTDSELLHNAIRDAYNAGILIVASAGNSADSAVKYPAAYDEVIAVGGTDTSGNIRTDLTTGEEIDIFAPAERILSTALLGGVMAIGGTSASAAQVTGVASLLLQKDTSKSPDFIKSLIKATAKEIAESNAGFIDYAYANEMYDDFESMYVPGEIAEYTNETPMENYAEEAEIVVEGLWSEKTTSTGHNAQSNYAGEAAQESVSEFTDYYIGIVNYACTNVDAQYGSNGDAGMGKIQAFHGRGNYVANIRFVSNFAQYMADGNGLTTAISKCCAKFPDLVEVVNGKCKAIDKNEDSDGMVMEAMAGALENIYNNLGTEEGLYTEDSHGPRRRMLVFLGVALHMIGDVYAHRTIVHSYTVSGTLPTSMKTNETHKDKFGTEDFIKHADSNNQTTAKLKEYVFGLNPFEYESKWGTNGSYMRNITNLKNAVNGGFLEFQDITRFETSSSTHKYDDKATFCKERHSEAKRLCKKYLVAVIETNFPDYTDIVKFYPKYIVPNDGEYVKLNNLKNYVIAAGLSTSGYSAGSWAKYSTTDYV